MTELAVSRYIVTISVAFLGAVLGAFLLAGPPDEAAADEPEITFQYPKSEGDVFLEPLKVIQICFAEPVDVRDKPPGGEGDFNFKIERPDSLGLGMRIVFQANGYGVALYPGILDEGFEGEWALNFEVRDAESLLRLGGRIAWEVQAGGEPIITPTPAVCPTSGQPPSTPIDDPDGTPGASETPSSAPDGTVGLDDGGDVDTLRLVLLTLGAVGGAAVIVLAGYLIRKRVGFWLHRPPEDDGSSEDEH